MTFGPADRGRRGAGTAWQAGPGEDLVEHPVAGAPVEDVEELLAQVPGVAVGRPVRVLGESLAEPLPTHRPRS